MLLKTFQAEIANLGIWFVGCTTPSVEEFIKKSADSPKVKLSTAGGHEGCTEMLEDYIKKVAAL